MRHELCRRDVRTRSCVSFSINVLHKQSESSQHFPCTHRGKQGRRGAGGTYIHSSNHPQPEHFEGLLKKKMTPIASDFDPKRVFFFVFFQESRSDHQYKLAKGAATVRQGGAERSEAGVAARSHSSGLVSLRFDNISKQKRSSGRQRTALRRQLLHFSNRPHAAMH